MREVDPENIRGASADSAEEMKNTIPKAFGVELHNFLAFILLLTKISYYVP